MIWNVFSFLLTHEESFVELNPNILETNLVNILLLIGLLVYGNKVSVQPNLEQRQKEIGQTIENAQKDVVSSSNYYSLAEQGFLQSIFWLHSWKSISEKEKVEIVTKKFQTGKSGLASSFLATEKFIENFEKKTFLSFQRYILFLTASRILRKFLFLSEAEQSNLIETIIAKLGGERK
jgi:F-type H+-transporting ATPase subunit b